MGAKREATLARGEGVSTDTRRVARALGGRTAGAIRICLLLRNGDRAETSRLLPPDQALPLPLGKARRSEVAQRKRDSQPWSLGLALQAQLRAVVSLHTPHRLSQVQ